MDTTTPTIFSISLVTSSEFNPFVQQLLLEPDEPESVVS